MDCINHAGTPAVAQCTGCGEAFCANCVVEIQGASYCNDCKSMAVSHAPVREEDMIPCSEANDAIKYAIIGIFCFGIILEPVAIVMALKARKKIAMNPRLSGAGKATAGLIIGIVSLVLWVIGIIAQVAAVNQGVPGPHRF